MNDFGNGKATVPVIVPGTETLLMGAVPADGRGNNDFCVARDDNGLWHLFSITWYRADSPAKPRCWLSHATAERFLGPWRREPYLLLSPTNNWAPHIVRDAKNPAKLLMFLGGMEHDTLRCYEADAGNLFDWTLRRDLGQSLGTRDPMILFVEEEKLYYMYTTFTTQENGNVGVAVSVSPDLGSWRLLHIIRALPGDNVDESPFVVRRDGLFYLWTTRSSRAFYAGIPTRVFCSADAAFRDIPTTAEENCVASAPVHAVEIVGDGGKLYLCQTGTGGPGIVANELRWAVPGERESIPADRLDYSGAWSTDATDFYSSQPGDRFSCRFQGRRIEYRASRGMDGGVAEIFLDGKSCGKFDQYACDGEVFQETYRDAFLWTSADLKPGEHELCVAVTGEHAPLAEGCKVNVNRLVAVK